ncbi:Gfo/Idh/MocA family protein [Neobacillus niacini]|uniref:Gfo/Idh/MocA family protein n=1 Tax=Neobacillus niacini TaxID=86668 RepID=UPI00398383F2
MVYKIALIGAGIIADYHLEALQELRQKLTPIAIADINEEKARRLALHYNLTPYSDYKEMVIKEKPDIVVIALPHFLHKEAALWCAQSKCHILLEKPMALHKKECEIIIQEAERNSIKLLVGHTQHYLPENLLVKEMIEAGTFGQLVMINDTRHLYYFYENRPDWFFHKEQSGGGILMNLGAHSIDKIQWLTGSTIAKVKASVSYFGNKGDVEGSGVVYLETSNGIPATISQSGYPGVPKNETEIIFSKGMIKLISGKGVWVSENGEYRQVAIENSSNPFILQFEDLLESIENNSEPECSGTYAKSVIAAIETIYQSHQSGKELAVELRGDIV